MAERPPRYVRHGSSRSSTRAAAVAGLVAGLVALALIGWQVSTMSGGKPTTPTTTVASTGPPPKPVLRIIFPEGFTRTDMAERITAVNKIAKKKRHISPKLRAKQYLQLTRSSSLPAKFAGDKQERNLEGFLFPATYDFNGDTKTKQLLKMQLNAFRNAWKSIDLGYAESKNLTAYDVLIIASMVEKEVQVPRERPLVAAVIYNRLHVGLPLGIDATIRYGLHIAPTEPIHESELESDSPYNTRKFTGLPPTPIGNPGLASIQAAAHPTKIDYLYFVRKPDCKSHYFTASESKFFEYTHKGGLNC